MCFECFGSLFPEHLFGRRVDLGTSLDFWAGVNLALGALGDEIQFLNGSEPQGAVLGEAGEEALLPPRFTEASGDAARWEGACGFLAVPFEGVSLR